MENCILSIIVPVFNVEAYLRKCIDSLINQEIKNYEIILINDGSTDNSEKICIEYKNKYPHIINYIYKKNSGLSETRNTGIREAKGEYICFIDSDDYIEKNSLSKFITIINKEKPDIIYYGYYYEKESFIEGRFSYKSEKNKTFSKDDFLISELSKRNLPIPACFGLYKKKIILDNNLFFVSGILHEDERWSPQILLKSNKIFTTDHIIYHYVQRSDSITHKRDKTKNGLDLLETAIYLLSVSSDIRNPKERKLFKNRIAMVYMKGVTIGKLYRKEYKKRIKRFLPIVNAYFLIDKIKALIFLVNLNLYCYLNNKFKK